MFKRGSKRLTNKLPGSLPIPHASALPPTLSSSHSISLSISSRTHPSYHLRCTRLFYILIPPQRRADNLGKGCFKLAPLTRYAARWVSYRNNFRVSFPILLLLLLFHSSLPFSFFFQTAVFTTAVLHHHHHRFAKRHTVDRCSFQLYAIRIL